MSICKKSRPSYIQIVAGMCIIFILLMILTPFAYIREQNLLSQSKRSGTASNHSGPMEHFGEAYIISDMVGTEILIDIEINYMISRHVRDFQRLLRDVMNTVILPSLSFKIILLSALFINKTTQQQIPVMAISIGGHAPPQKILMN